MCSVRVSLLLVIFGFVLTARAIHFPQQTISFTNNFDGSLKTIGNANIVNGTLFLTTGVDQASAVYFNASRLPIGSGFYSAVNISVDNCNQGNGGEGFTLFLTPDAPTSAAVSASSGNQLGIGGVTEVYMAGYSTTANNFYGCSWVSLTGLFTDVCPFSQNTGPVFGCLGQNTARFEFSYSTSTSSLLIYYNGALQFNGTLEIPPGFYYVGLSGATGLSTGGSYYRQTVNSWTFQSFATDFFSFESVNLNYSQNFNINESILIGASNIENGSLILTPARGSKSGALIYQPTNDTDGKVEIWGDFNASIVIDWQNCSQSYGGADGFLLFLTPDLPNATDVLNANGGGLGLSYSKNIYMTGYTSTFDYFYACHWAVPPTSTLQFYCPFAVNKNTTFKCDGEPYLFEFYYNSIAKTMAISVNGIASASIPFDIPNGRYYLGISGATGGQYYKQTVSSWTFMNKPPIVEPPQSNNTFNNTSTSIHFPKRSFNFDRNFNDSLIRTVGNAMITSGSVLLTNGTILQSSTIIYASRMAIGTSGFHSAIKISVDRCDSKNGGDGFTLFLTPDAPTGTGVGLSSGNQLGIGFVPNIYMAGYSTVNDVFYSCSWFTNGSPFIDSCPYEHNSNTIFGCFGLSSALFEFYYANSTIQVYYNGTLQLNKTMEIPPGFYSVGISGATGLSYYRQIVQAWNFTTYGADFDFEIVHLNRTKNFNSNESLLLGSSKVDNGSLVLNPAKAFQAGALIYQPSNDTDPRVGIFGNFYTSVVVDWSNCTYDNGAEGFVFFLTRDPPNPANISKSFGPGLAVHDSTNMYIAGYIRRTNNLIACNWAAPTQSDIIYNCPTILNYADFATCDGEPYLYEFYYDATALTMTIVINGTLPVAPITLDIPFGHYYIGIAGSTGAVYFKQTISSWTFTNDPTVKAPLPTVQTPPQVQPSFTPEVFSNTPIRQQLSGATYRSAILSAISTLVIALVVSG